MVQGDLMWARMRAISENNDFAIIFGSAGVPPDLSNNTYYIYDDNDGDFGTVGPETGELVKTGVIPDQYKGVGYGFVTGIYDGNPQINEGVDPSVTFSSKDFGGLVGRRIWFKFEPTGRSNKAGSIYLIQNEGPTTINSRRKRMYKITVITTGRIGTYRWHSGPSDGIWE